MNVLCKTVFLGVIAICISVSDFRFCEAGKGKLKVIVTGIANSSGTVNLALFNSASEYASKEGKPFMKSKEIIRNNRAEFEFDDVSFGEYGIKAYHDENGNGVMDKNFMGIPKENYAFSNNARGTFGSPSYDKVKFTFNKSDMTLEIKMTSAE